MTATEYSDTELLTEHLGYAPVSIIDDIINAANFQATRALNSIESHLLAQPPKNLGFKLSSRNPKHNSQDAAAVAAAAAQEEKQAFEERTKMEIEAGTHQLETLLCASIDRNFDKFEIYVLRNILTVRPPAVRGWMRLSHYEGLDFSSSLASPSAGGGGGGGGGGSSSNANDTTKNDAPSLDSINHLRRKLRESMRLNTLLTREHTQNEHMLEKLHSLVGAPGSAGTVKTESVSPHHHHNTTESLVPKQGSATKTEKEDTTSSSSPFAFLHQKGDTLTGGGADAPLGTTTAFTLSQMQALRALSTSLSNMTPDLKKASSSVVDADGDSSMSDGVQQRKSWRRERLEYVEGATRRHLETVQGLELGRDGEVRDGEWQGEGRNLARGEVEGLERVVAILGGSGGGGGNGHNQVNENENGNGDAVAAELAGGLSPVREQMDES
ncbi:Uu.00g060120.m01.CDS01 [Anthostomella pinea]|uniref:Uu.00g060120.m01.CDS01 n=1 Tax=Anthostomella pinea TaxID=933095 RepID=A0AAI8YME0_9PEZI|nr:Uu.00g060120.m01.CDS01 [Anthostomella pinea]